MPAPVHEGDTEAVGHAMRGLFGRDSLYMALWAVQLVAAAALTPVITRLTGSAEFGGVAAANAVMQLLFVVAGLGLNTAIQREHAASSGTGAPKLLMLSLVLAAVVTAAVDAGGRWWSPYVGFEHYAGAIRLAILWAGASAVTNSALALLRSQDRLLAFSSVSLLQSVVAEALSVLLLITVGPTATSYLLGQLLAQLAALALGLALARPTRLRTTDWGLAKNALGYSLPLVPAVLSTFVLGAADRLILHDQLGATAVARYQIASNLGSIPILLLGVLSSAWMPRIFALTDHTDRAAVLAASRDALYRLLIPVLVGLSLGIPVALRVWAPASYRPDGLLTVTAVVIVSAVPYAAGLSVTRALLAANRTGVIAAATLLAATANIGLNALLIPRFGLIGSPVATLLAYLLLHGVLVLRARTASPVRPTGPPLLLALAAAAAFALLIAAVPTTPGVLLVRTILAVACLGWFGRVLFRLRPGATGPNRRARTEPVST